VAEFPHLWAKAAKKWRRFSIRGVVKAGIEALRVVLTHDIQWIRLCGGASKRTRLTKLLERRAVNRASVPCPEHYRHDNSSPIKATRRLGMNS
jgi:hypothetical protein